MNPRIPLGFCLLILLLAAACGSGETRRNAGEPGLLEGEESADTAAADGEEPPEDLVPLDPADHQVEVVLYFADVEGRLVPEQRLLERRRRPADQAREIIFALLEGPRITGMSQTLSPVLPPETRVRAVHLGADGTAYVDLDASFAQGLSQGSEDALIAVQALTETLAANLQEVGRLKILVEGEEVRDLGGHLDLSQPLIPSARL